MFSVLFILIIILVAFGVRIVNQYERGVVLRFGKFHTVKDPGLRLIIPLVDRMIKVSMRIVTMPVPAQNIITKDNVSIDVSAVAYYQIMDPEKSVIAIENVMSAVNQIAQTTVRNIVGQFHLDEVLSETVTINEKIKVIIDQHTEPWGVTISVVEIKDIQLPETMQRAMAKQAEAEREKRAKIIAADGEFQSADKLSQAAAVISKQPIALQLRNLQVLLEISAEKNSTIIFPSQFMSSFDDMKKFMAKEMNIK